MTKSNQQFLACYLELIDQGLKPNAVFILSKIYDRMKSSIKRTKYFDVEQKAFFVIYTAPQMAAETNLSEKTVRRYFHDLEDQGFIRLMNTDENTTYHIFTPQFLKRVPTFSFTPMDIKFSREWSECPVNHTYLITSFKDFKTVNTETPNTLKKSATKITQVPKPEKHFKQTPAIELWKQSTIAKMHLPQFAVDQIALFTHSNVEQARLIVKHISIARSKVAKDNHISNTPVTQFESNERIQHTLGMKLKTIFSYIKQHGFTEYAGFLIKSLKTYFLDAFGIKADVKPVNPSAPKKHQVRETLPAWAKDDQAETHVHAEITDEQKALLREQLAKLTA